MKQTNQCVIFIPGFKGSLLRNQNEKFIWPNFFSAQLSKATLNFNLPELDIFNRYHYHSTDIVKSVALIPYLYQVDIYGSFIKNFNKFFGSSRQLIIFHYDWRDHLSYSVTKLNDLILNLKSQGIDKIDIIAHSMGGLIACYVLRYGKNNLKSQQEEWGLAPLLNKIIFAATPFRGTIRALYDIRYGAKIGWNRSLLAPKTMCTFPSAYYLLPSYQGAFTVNGQTGSKERSLFDINTWEQHQLSFLNQDIPDQAIKKNRLAYLQNCLLSGKKFTDLLHANSKTKPFSDTNIRLISSDSHESLSKIEIAQNPTELRWQYAKGDGSISTTAMQPPELFSLFATQKYLTNAEHSRMFANKDVQEICWQELNSN